MFYDTVKLTKILCPPWLDTELEKIEKEEANVTKRGTKQVASSCTSSTTAIVNVLVKLKHRYNCVSAIVNSLDICYQDEITI